MTSIQQQETADKPALIEQFQAVLPAAAVLQTEEDLKPFEWRG